MTNRILPIVVCADDYGLSPGVGQAIRDLIAAGRLSATSCMTTTESWPAESKLIVPFLDRADVGLHFTLTDHRPLGPMPTLAPNGRFPSVSALAKAGLARRLDRAEIAAEFERQIDAFETATGRSPAFIDGHHHVHGFPGVADAVLGVFRRRLRGKGIYLRCCDESLPAVITRGAAPLHAAMISLFGRRFARLARAAGYDTNRHFVGVRRFAEGEDCAELMRRFLARPRPGTLLMCHPGLCDSLLPNLDGVTWQREEEYHYLAGPQFLEALESNGLHVARFTPATA